MLLVFSSNIVTLVNDVKAVNRFVEAGKAIASGTVEESKRNATIEALTDFDYIQCVSLLYLL